MGTPNGHDRDRFSGVGVSRRDFARLAAATAGALALPANATASVSASAMDAEYEYVLNHTPAEYAVPTLVTFADASGPDAMDAAVDGEVLTTTEPRPAAYAKLTTTQAAGVAELPTADTLSHSPGSNPFWRLGYYPLGVFPEPRRSTGFVDYEQMVSGLSHLEDEHPDRLRFYSIGKSPGHYNEVSAREDPKGVHVAEVTNDVGDAESFREKTKVLYSLSLHGLERAGAEAGSRFIEGLLRGNEGETEALLDDVVLVFVYPNPDGWVAKHPQYESGWQFLGPDAGAPVAPFYERGNAAVYDTNRQYPAVGWIDPSHYPAEPEGANLADDEPGVDSDVPERTGTRAPDALAFVEHLRSYENLEYGTDMHGAINSSNFVEGLIGQGKFDNGEFHELYQLCLAIDGTLEDALDAWTAAGDAQETVTGDTNVAPLGFGTLPEQAFDYAAVWDTIGYSGTGFLGDWLPQPESVGGLDLISLDFEMAYSHIVGANVYDPELIEMQVTGYRTAIRTLAAYATREVTSTIESDGASTAYVATDALTRRSADLDFGATSTEGARLASGESTSVATGVPEGTRTLSIHPHAERALVAARLVAPDGTTVREFAPGGDRPGARCCGMADWTVAEPAAGTWTVELARPAATDGSTTDAGTDAATADGVGTAVAPVAVGFTTLQVSGTNPDPREVLGYEQRPYEVTPLRYFEEYAADVDGPVEPVTIAEVADGALSDYGNAVVIHDEGIGDADYVDALDSFVAGGGNLVLTDSGVTLTGTMDAGPAADLAPDDVTREELYIANVGERNGEHPLLADTRPIQRELWKIAPLGYSTGTEAPMWLLDETSFADAGGSVAGTTDGLVAAGTLAVDDGAGTDGDGSGGSIHLLGGLLPPASQAHLHPFGLLDYAVSFLGHTILTNALGFRQVRRVDGEVVKTFGPGEGG
jgi:hypothetical protein